MISQKQFLFGLKELASFFCEDLKEVIYSDSPLSFSTWDAPIENGKSLEFLCLCASIFVFREHGFHVAIPNLYRYMPGLFYLRNVIPTQYTSQAGHSVHSNGYVSLKDRFIASLTPKVLITDQVGREYCLFREGHPIHMINWRFDHHAVYRDRPDILLAPGAIEIVFGVAQEIHFVYKASAGHCEGVLRIRDSADIPLASFQKTQHLETGALGIIECSVSKGQKISAKQYHIYKEIFSGGLPTRFLLVNNNRIANSPFEQQLIIDLVNSPMEITKCRLIDGLTKYWLPMLELNKNA